MNSAIITTRIAYTARSMARRPRNVPTYPQRLLPRLVVTVGGSIAAASSRHQLPLDRQFATHRSLFWQLLFEDIEPLHIDQLCELRISMALNGLVPRPWASALGRASPATPRRSSARAGSSDGRCDSRTFDAACRNVAAGLGIAIIPRESAEPYAQALGLRILQLTDPWAERRFVICMRSRESLSEVAALLVDYLHERAGEDAGGLA